MFLKKTFLISLFFFFFSKICLATAVWNETTQSWEVDWTLQDLKERRPVLLQTPEGETRMGTYVDMFVNWSYRPLVAAGGYTIYKGYFERGRIFSLDGEVSDFSSIFHAVPEGDYTDLSYFLTLGEPGELWSTSIQPVCDWDPKVGEQVVLVTMTDEDCELSPEASVRAREFNVTETPGDDLLSWMVLNPKDGFPVCEADENAPVFSADGSCLHGILNRYDSRLSSDIVATSLKPWEEFYFKTVWNECIWPAAGTATLVVVGATVAIILCVVKKKSERPLRTPKGKGALQKEKKIGVRTHKQIVADSNV